MAYKFSKGGRELGDIEYENDGDTKINFEEDYISLEAGGNPVLTVSGSRVGVLNNSPREALDINGTLLLSSSANQELIRISKANADIREITFENEGADIGSIYFNAAEHMFIRQEDASKDLSLRVGTTNAVRCDGSTSRVGIHTDTPSSTLSVAGSLSLNVTYLNAGNDPGTTYTVTDTDCIILISTRPSGQGGIDSAITLTLPDADNTSGRVITIKDAGGYSSTNPITINADSGDNFEGNPSTTSLTIQSDASFKTLVAAGSGWYEIGN